MKKEEKKEKTNFANIKIEDGSAIQSIYLVVNTYIEVDIYSVS